MSIRSIIIYLEFFGFDIVFFLHSCPIDHTILGVPLDHQVRLVILLQLNQKKPDVKSTFVVIRMGLSRFVVLD